MWEVLAPAMVISIVALTAGVTLVLRGPLGKALADRIGGRVDSRPDERIEQVHTEIAELRVEMAELQERLDFAERLLAQQRGRPALPER